MPKLLIHFARFGPYHLARLRSASEALAPLGWTVKGLQVCSTDSIYDWSPSQFDDTNGSLNPDIITAFPGAAYEDINAVDIKSTFVKILDREQPEAITVAGWSSVDALACCRWAQQRKCKAILMSETRQLDGRRVWWKEAIKSRRVRRFDAALVGGRSHADYLVKLGMPAERIGFGYNVVDNDYFANAKVALGCQSCEHERNAHPWFLTSNRFVPIKNLNVTLQAYQIYLQKIASLHHLTTTPTRSSNPSQREVNSAVATESISASVSSEAWNLCLLGDGPLCDSLKTAASAIGARVRTVLPWEDDYDLASQQPTIYFPGFRQIEELPRLYARAAAFLHPAMSEPWGLVINEAMASSLPILSSRNVGAAEELVDKKVNGFLFDPASPHEMADAMSTITQMDEPQRLIMGQHSLRIINERMPTNAFGKGLAMILRKTANAR
ncbi:glycosyltransferase family 4 protein [Novipirellula caenicola]|uniref:Glycosyl transferase family 1 domain-containing protein n=1 Tax=Novipirellula caenicola TaxID=1536901 RepID=A0ABP9W3H4_9BACT